MKRQSSGLAASPSPEANRPPADTATPAVATHHAIPALQVLRALAALLVVCWHSHLATRYAQHDYWPEGDAAFRALHYPAVLNHLDLGVDLFFCISGFIMHRLISDLPPTAAAARGFLVQRAIRILPPYWLCTGFVVLVFVASHGRLNVGGLTGDAGVDTPRVFTSLLLLPESRAPVLGVGWTLIHEAMFYLVCGLTLVLGLQRRLPEVLALLSATALVLAWRRIELLDGYLFSSFSMEFCCGALASRWLGRTVARPLLLVVCGMLGFCGLSWALDRPPDLPLRAAWRALGAAPLGLLLLRGAIGADHRHAFTKGAVGRSLVRIGDASYTLYLVHWLILSALGRLLALAPATPVAGVAAWHLFSILAAVAGAVLLAERVELPVHRALKRRLRVSASSALQREPYDTPAA